MVLLAEDAPLLFVATVIWLWVRASGEQEKFQDRLTVGRALAAGALAPALGRVIGCAILGGVMGALIHKTDEWLAPIVRYADGVGQEIVGPRKRE